MQNANVCPQCGVEFDPDSPAGLCPKCLLAAGLESTGIQQPLEEPTLPPDPSTQRQIQDADVKVGTHIKYFGDYELLEEIARGGMGVVYKARQTSLNRIVALKMILTGQLAGEEDVKRFHAEAEAAANLDHPGIVPIFEVGQHEGQHYFSMGNVEGDSLADRIARGPLSPKEAAQLVKRLAEAVAYAHSNGVVHRDLKPGNVLLAPSTRLQAEPDDERDGELANPKLTDFGLAKRIDTDSGLTATGQILGTPSYMSPEQASGKTDEITPAADIYALGAILYACLTGRPPFQADSALNTVMQVLENEPVAPCLLNSAIPKDLEAVCLKCLEKRVHQRYASAEELVDDLNQFLSDNPVSARKLTALTRLWRWSDRNIGRWTAIWIVVLALIPGIVFLGLGFLSGEWPWHLLAIAYACTLVIAVPTVIAMLLSTRLHQMKRAQALRSPSSNREKERSVMLIAVGGIMCAIGLIAYAGLLIQNGWQIPRHANLFLYSFLIGLSILATGFGYRPYR